MPADVDETRFASPATAKADAVTRRGTATLAADSEVELDGERLGKPHSDGDAFAMLASLAGQTHEVRTEVVVDAPSGRRLSFAVRSHVVMRALTAREI